MDIRLRIIQETYLLRQIVTIILFFKYNYTWTSPSGEVWTKAVDLALVKSIKSVKSREAVITSWVIAEMKVRVYGDAAVVTGRSTVKETYKGKDFSGQYRWTDTWIKIAGGWQCVAGHSSEIAQK